MWDFSVNSKTEKISILSNLTKLLIANALQIAPQVFGTSAVFLYSLKHPTRTG